MSVVLGRHFEKQEEQSALRSRIDIDNDCELIIDANAHVSGAVKLGQWNVLNDDGIDSYLNFPLREVSFSSSAAHGAFDQSVVSASLTPAFGGYAGTRHDMSPDYLYGDTYPTFVTGTGGSSSYWEFDGINNAFATMAVGGSVGARSSNSDLGKPDDRNHFATSVNMWVRDSGTRLSNVADGGTGSNQAYSKIWSVEDDHIALEEDHSSVTLALSGRLTSGYGGNVSHTDFRPSMTGSSGYTSAVVMSGSTQPGSVFMWAGTTETATGSLATGVHSKQYALLVPKVTYGMGTDNTGTYNAGTFSQSLHTFSDYSLGGNEPNLSAPSASSAVTRGGAASLYEHLGSPVSGSKIVCIDHTRPNNVYEFTVKEVGDTSGTPAAGFPAETDKYLVMDETCLCNGVSTPISGSANSPHGSGAFQGVAQGDGRLITVKLAGHSDKIKFYQNGHNQIVENSIDHTLKQSNGWVNYCVVIKADNESSSAGQVTKVYKNGQLVQKLEGVGRFIGDMVAPNVSSAGKTRRFYIGRSSTSNKSYWKGKVAFCAVYIKELEPGEVMGNYFALKDRYIGK